MRIVPIEDIEISENRQRKEFTPEALIELQSSIEEVGLLNAIVVREQGSKLILVSGERRLRAIMELHKLEVPLYHNGIWLKVNEAPVVTLGELSPLEAEQAELDENICRKDLTWQERSQALLRLSNLRQAQAAEKGETYTTRDLALEVRGDARGGYQQAIRTNLIVAKHLDNPLINRAKTADEAYKLLKHEEKRQANIQLAQEVGKTFQNTDHKVLKGNCLEILAEEQFKKKFDVILIDPPYGMGATEFGDAGGRRDYVNHSYTDDSNSFKVLMAEFMRLSSVITKDEAHMYIFCDIDQFHNLKGWAEAAGWYVFRTPFVYYKRDATRVPLPDRGPRRAYELILYAIKGNKQVNQILNDVIEGVQDNSIEKMHGARKPISVYTNLLQRSVKAGDEVLDAFAGSGTLLPAAHSLLCKATLIEQEEEYYGLCLQRLKALRIL